MITIAWSRPITAKVAMEMHSNIKRTLRTALRAALGACIGVIVLLSAGAQTKPTSHRVIGPPQIWDNRDVGYIWLAKHLEPKDPCLACHTKPMARTAPQVQPDPRIDVRGYKTQPVQYIFKGDHDAAIPAGLNYGKPYSQPYRTDLKIHTDLLDTDVKTLENDLNNLKRDLDRLSESNKKATRDLLWLGVSLFCFTAYTLWLSWKLTRAIK